MRGSHAQALGFQSGNDFIFMAASVWLPFRFRLAKTEVTISVPILLQLLSKILFRGFFSNDSCGIL